MRALLSVALILVSSFLFACSDGECRDNEVKVGTVCLKKNEPAADARVDEDEDGDGGSDTTKPTGSSKRDAATKDALADADDAQVNDASVAVDAALPAADHAAVPADASVVSSEPDAAPMVMMSEPDAAAPSMPSMPTMPVTPAPTCLTDADGDGFGVEPATAPCPASGKLPKSGDCNDAAKTAFPGGTEMCGDGVDNDCNGKVDDGMPEQCNGIDDDCNPATADGAGACGTYQCRAGTCITKCSKDDDCVSGLHCVAGSCEGTQDGAACAEDGQCASGSCTTANKCGAKVAVNGSCNSAGDCPSGTSCAGATCKVNNGSTCNNDSDCASQTCLSTCQAAKSGLDGPCDSPTDCSSDFECKSDSCKAKVGKTCTADAKCGSGICAAGTCVVERQKLNGACDETIDCVDGLSCAAKICKYNDSHSCGADDECQHGACLPANGATPAGCGTAVTYNVACNSPADCQVGLVCSNLPNRTCLKTFGQNCVDDGECGEGTCAPGLAGLPANRSCRAPGQFYDYCDLGGDDCYHVGQTIYLTCTADRVGGVPRCRRISGEPCSTDDECDYLTCSGGLCD